MGPIGSTVAGTSGTEIGPMGVGNTTGTSVTAGATGACVGRQGRSKETYSVNNN